MVLHLHYVNDKYVKLSRLSETLVLEMFNFFLFKKRHKDCDIFSCHIFVRKIQILHRSHFEIEIFEI